MHLNALPCDCFSKCEQGVTLIVEHSSAIIAKSNLDTESRFPLSCPPLSALDADVYNCRAGPGPPRSKHPKQARRRIMEIVKNPFKGKNQKISDAAAQPAPLYGATGECAEGQAWRSSGGGIMRLMMIIPPPPSKNSASPRTRRICARSLLPVLPVCRIQCGGADSLR